MALERLKTRHRQWEKRKRKYNIIANMLERIRIKI